MSTGHFFRPTCARGIAPAVISAPTPDSSQMCARSVERPSLRSIIADASRFSRRKRPIATRGTGAKWRRKSWGFGLRPARNSCNAAADPPSEPVTKTSSPGRAPERNMARPRGTYPVTTMSAHTPAGDSAVSPPARTALNCSAVCNTPFMKASTHRCGNFRGNASDRKTVTGSPPMAAISLRPRTRQRLPTTSGGCHSRRK